MSLRETLDRERAKIGNTAFENPGGNSRDRREPILTLASSSEVPTVPRLQPHGVRDFLKLNIKPREMLLDPILPQKGLAMLYGTRGTGKTMVTGAAGFVGRR
jgi:hypothetical protein